MIVYDFRVSCKDLYLFHDFKNYQMWFRNFNDFHKSKFKLEDLGKLLDLQNVKLKIIGKMKVKVYFQM